MREHRIPAAVAAAILLFLTSASASPLEQLRGTRGLTTTLAASDAVFVGRVASVRYAMSSASKDGSEGPQPFTFVTFDVERQLHGAPVGQQVTLRFAGGLHDGHLFTMSSAGTLFDEGERSVLFVRGNGTDSIPLVGGRAGRLRLSGGRVFDDAGRALALEAGDRLVPGRVEKLAEVRSHFVPELGRDILTGARLRGPVIDAGAPDDPGLTAEDLASTPPAPEPTTIRADLTEERLVETLRTLAANLGPATRALISTDAAVPFAATATIPVPAR